MGGNPRLLAPTVYGDPNLYQYILQNLLGYIVPPGTSFFVDLRSGKGSDTNDGLSWGSALATIQKGFNLCTSGEGDVVAVKGFTGTADAIENLTLTKRDVSLIAVVPVGNAMRLTIAPTTGIALDLQTGSQGFYCYGVRFAGVSAVGVKIGTDGPRFVECDFNSDTTHGVSFVASGVTNGTGSGAKFINCLMAECGGNGIITNKGTGAALGLQATNVMLSNCQLYRNTGPDIGDDAGTQNPTYFYQWLIEKCSFSTRNKATYLDMRGGLAQDLMIRDCDFNDAGLNNVKIKIPAANAGWVRNADSTGLVAQASIT